MCRRWNAHVLAWLLLVLCPAAPVVAQQGAEACVEVHFQTLCMTGPVAAAEALTVVSGDPGGAYRLAIGAAEVGPGRIQVTTYGNGEQVGTQALAFGRSEDVITINAPVPPGTPGWFVARVRVGGTLQASSYNNADLPAQGFARAILLASFRAIAGGVTFESNLTGNRTSTGQFTGDESGTMETEVDFVFGQPIAIRIYLQAFSQGNGQNFGAGAAGLARASYGNSAAWTGLGTVRFFNGDPVPGVTVTSASGTDYQVDFSLDPLFGHGFDY